MAKCWDKLGVMDAEELVFRTDRLDRLMEKRGLGPGELAYLSGVSYNMIYKMRMGERPNPSASIAVKLAKALDTTVEFLVDVPQSEDENVLAEEKAPYNAAHLDDKQRAILEFLNPFRMTNRSSSFNWRSLCRRATRQESLARGPDREIEICAARNPPPSSRRAGLDLLFQQRGVGGVMRYAWLLVLVFVLAGCGGDDEAPTPTPTKTPVPVEVVNQPVDTPTVAPTAAPVVVPTNTPAPIAATNTPVPPATDTPVPLPTSTPTPDLPVVASEANLRSGPGTDYDVVGQAAAGQALDLVGRNAAGDWYQLANGAWIAAFLVTGTVGDVAVVAAPALPTSVSEPVVSTPVPPVVAEQPTAPPPAAPTQSNVSLLIVINAGRDEVLGIRNDGGSPIDISGWRLDGDRGPDFCIIPGGTTLQPGEVFTVATGDAQPQGRGYKCGDKTIWNNEGEVIFLRATNGRVFQISTG